MGGWLILCLFQDSRAGECSGMYNCSLIPPTPSPSALILSHCLDFVVLSVLHCVSVTGYLTASAFSSPVPPRTQLCALAHTNTLQPGFCAYIPLKQFSPRPANLIKTLLLSSDGSWIFVLLFGFCLLYYIPHFLKCISQKFRHSTSFPWFQWSLYPLGQYSQLAMSRDVLWLTQGAGREGGQGGDVCVLSTSWGYRLGILLINILQCTRQLLTTKNCLVQNINSTEILLRAYTSNWLLIFSHGCWTASLFFWFFSYIF